MDLLTLVCAAVLFSFAFSAGFFLGSGNTRGVLHALAPAAVAALLSLPSIFDHEWSIAAIMVLGCFSGSILTPFISAANPFKRFCAQQAFVVFHRGSYKLGMSKDDSEQN